MTTDQTSRPETGANLRALSRDARAAAAKIEDLYQQATSLSATGREAGWPIPVAWFWEWHQALQAWANRLDELDAAT